MRTENEQQMLAIADDYQKYVMEEATKSINAKLPYTIIDHSFEDKRITYRFQTEEWMQNPYGSVHGGLIATMIDLAMGVTTRALCGNFTPTINLSLSYLNPVPAKGGLIIKTTATRVGGTFIQITAECYVEGSDKICTTASAAFYCNKKLTYRNKPVENN